MNPNSNNNGEPGEFQGLTLIPENAQVREQLCHEPALLTTDGAKTNIKTIEYILGNWNSVKDSAEYKATADALAKKGITRMSDDVNINIPYADISDSWMGTADGRGLGTVGSVVIIERINPENQELLFYAIIVFATESEAKTYVDSLKTKPLIPTIGKSCKVWAKVAPDPMGHEHLNDVATLGELNAYQAFFLTLMPTESLAAVCEYLAQDIVYNLCFE